MRIERAWIVALFLGAASIAAVACGDGGSSTSGGSSNSSSSASGTGGMGNAGGAGGMGSTGGAGGTGGMPECQMAVDCKNQGVANACGEPACEMGKCVRKALLPAGTVLPSQTYGDCLERQCDANADIAEVPVENDAFNDGNDCTDDVCMGGVLMHMPIMLGGACEGGICDGNGACVACVEMDPMYVCGVNKVCIAGFCAGSKCNNGSQDPGEGDIDCGGACGPCDDGKACSLGTQCKSGLCMGGLCAVPSCADGIQNGKETAPDCGGGGDCMPCPKDAPCAAATDCQSGVCIDNFCIAPSCMDNVQNGDEAGIDCGGAACNPCP